MRRSYIVAALLVFSLTAIVPISIDGEADLDPSELEYSENIVLEGDLALESKVLLEDWPGNGTSDDPFIIEGYVLESTWQGVGLYLDNISKHLIIRDCINDSNVSFGDSLGNAYIADSSNITFSNCVFNSGSMLGLLHEGSFNCTIMNCTFEIGGNQKGIASYYCLDISIKDSLFKGPFSGGIFIENGKRFIISDNKFDGIGYGFELGRLADSRIVRNVMENTNYVNLVGTFLENVTISDNVFDRSEYVSAWLYEVDGLRVERNEFKRSTFGLMGYLIVNATFIDNTLDCGYISVALEGFENITLSGNRMWNSSIHLKGDLEDYRSLNVNPGNEVNNLPFLFIKDEDMKGEEVDDNVGHILLVNVSNAVIYGRTMRDSFSPINLIGCEDISVTDCILNYNSGILYALSCNRLTVKNIEAVDLENGFHLEEVTNSIITGNKIQAVFDPIAVTSSNRNSIMNNEFTSLSGGAHVRFSDDNIFRSNIFSGGLSLNFSYRNAVEGNRISNGDLIIPENLLWDPEQPEPRNNIVRGFRQDYILNRVEENIRIPQGSKDLIFFNLTRCTIPVYKIENGKGVKILDCSDLIFREWELGSCDWGFEIWRSFRINVVDSEMQSTGRSGIELHSSTSCRVEGNMINMAGSGIKLIDCLRPEIFNNMILNTGNNGIGILEGNREFLIIRNEINSSAASGILVHRSQDGLISGNVLVENDEFGIALSNNADRNLIYNNHFIKNHGANTEYIENTRQAYDGGSDNSWYYEAPDVTIGNYWSDMQGPDENDDGISDLEYYTDGHQGTYDLYPMIKDHEPEEDIAGMGAGGIYLTVAIMIAILGIILSVAWRLMIDRRS
jgi:parallel beta-helix repeat protein